MRPRTTESRLTHGIKADVLPSAGRSEPWLSGGDPDDLGTAKPAGGGSRFKSGTPNLRVVFQVTFGLPLKQPTKRVPSERTPEWLQLQSEGSSCYSHVSANLRNAY